MKIKFNGMKIEISGRLSNDDIIDRYTLVTPWDLIYRTDLLKFSKCIGEIVGSHPYRGYYRIESDWYRKIIDNQLKAK